MGLKIRYSPWCYYENPSAVLMPVNDSMAVVMLDLNP